MTTLFISDLHLDATRPQIVEQFLAFLRDEAAKADALYILGDFFEAWIGDDAAGELENTVADALAKLHEHGVPVFFMHGNRDFLLGDAYARRARMTILPDPSVIDIEGDRILLMHGDTLCTDDARYQAFRAETRDARWQRAFLARPLSERQSFAAQARAESQRYTRSVDDAITDVNAATVNAVMIAHDTAKLIHGHTHRPAHHHFEFGDGKVAERIVLGDWHEQGSALLVNPNAITLTQIFDIC